MTIRDRIARAIAPYELEPTPETLATADRVIEALREPGEATIERMWERFVFSPSLTAIQTRLRAAYAAIWSEK